MYTVIFSDNCIELTFDLHGFAPGEPHPFKYSLLTQVHMHRHTGRCIGQFAILLMCIFVCFKRGSCQGCEC